MRAWKIDSPRGPPSPVDHPMPVPAKGEALVRVVAAGLNFADLLMHCGDATRQNLSLPYIPGMEFAGIVEALGPDTEGPTPGTRVLGVSGTGALAEWLCLPAGRLSTSAGRDDLRRGGGFSHRLWHLASGAGLESARLQPGETLFVTGAAGGVGLTAVEIGKRMGARVIASARGADRLAGGRGCRGGRAARQRRPGLAGRRAEGPAAGRRWGRCGL